MKKYFYSMVVMAIFAIGFAASGDNEETYVDEFGNKYHKVVLKCEMCGASPKYASYWETDGGSSINKPSSNMIEGRFYCTSCITEVEHEIDRKKGW